MTEQLTFGRGEQLEILRSCQLVDPKESTRHKSTAFELLRVIDRHVQAGANRRTARLSLKVLFAHARVGRTAGFENLRWLLDLGILGRDRVSQSEWEFWICWATLKEKFVPKSPLSELHVVVNSSESGLNEVNSSDSEPQKSSESELSVPMVLNHYPPNQKSKNHNHPIKPSQTTEATKPLPRDVWNPWRKEALRINLANPAEVLRLWHWATENQVVEESERNLREFFIQAAHALAKATKGHPGGLFAFNVANRNSLADAQEEQTGLAMLKRAIAPKANCEAKQAPKAIDFNDPANRDRVLHYRRKRYSAEEIAGALGCDPECIPPELLSKDVAAL